MTTNELMNFDWVYCDGEPIQVIIYGESICTPAGGERKAYRLEPIPLTPEILEKNGWSYDDISGEWYGCYGCGLTIGGYNPEYIIFDGRHIRYVHELQHALRLCGIKKEITL